MIHEEICTYEVCKLAKKKGFDVPTHYAYNDNCRKAMYMELCLNRNTKDNRSISAPTQSLLQRWLREEKNIDIAIVPLFTGVYSYIVYNIHCRDNRVVNTNAGYANFPLALDDALKNALEHLA